MKKLYRQTERGFEKVAAIATAVLGNSITFILAVCMVLFWWINKFFTTEDIHLIIGDIIFGVTFLYLFVIQKSFDHFSASLHLKVNELVSSHKGASNAVMNAEEKTVEEIIELSKEYVELAERTTKDEEKLEQLQKTMDTQ